jgi:hypothetical protein
VALVDISFVDDSAWVYGTTSVAPAYPTGLQEGDIVFMYVHSKLSTNTPTTPANWSLANNIIIGSGTNGAGTGPTLVSVYHRTVPSGGLTGTQTVSITSGNSAMAIMVAYRSTAGAFSLWSVSGPQGSSSASGSGTRTVTPNAGAAGAVAVKEWISGVIGIPSNTPTIGSPTCTLTGCTFDTFAASAFGGTTNGNDIGALTFHARCVTGPSTATTYSVSYSLPTTARTSGAVVWHFNCNGPEEKVGTDTFALGTETATVTPVTYPVIRSSSGSGDATNTSTSCAVAKPNGLEEGDYLLAIQGGDAEHTPGSNGAPSGFTQLKSVTGGAANNYGGMTIWGKVATSTDVAASTFTFTDISTSEQGVILMAIANGTYDPGNPVDVSATFTIQNRTATLPQTVASTTGAVDELLLAIYCTDTNGAVESYPTSGPSGMSLVRTQQSLTGSPWMVVGVYQEPITSAGATGVKTVTPTGATSNNGWTSLAIMVHPASTATPKTASDAFAFTDTVEIERASTVTDTFALTDTAALARSSSVGDTAAFTDVSVLAQASALTDSFALGTETATVLQSQTLTASDSFALTETVQLARSSALTDSISFTDTAVLEQLLLKTATDAFTFTDVSALLISLAVTASDTFTLGTETPSVAINASVNDTFALGTETASIVITAAVSDTYAFTDTQTGAQTLDRTDTFAFTDTSLLEQIIFKVASDTFSFTDTSSLLQVVAITASDNFSFTDTVSALALSYAVSDNFTPSDVVTSLAVTLAASDAFAFTDTSALARTNFFTAFDTFALGTETASLVVTLVGSDSFVATDTSVGSATTTGSDTFAFTDSIVVQKGSNPTATDTFDFTDAASVSVTSSRSDSFVFTDTATVSQIRTATDTFAFTESVAIVRSSAVSDTFDTTDTSKTLSVNVSASDTFAFTDTAINGASRSVNDTFALGTESAIVVVEVIRQDSFTFTDTSASSAGVQTSDAFALGNETVTSASAFLASLDTFQLTENYAKTSFDLVTVQDLFAFIDNALLKITVGGPWPIAVSPPMVLDNAIAIIGAVVTAGTASISIGAVPVIRVDEAIVTSTIDVEVEPRYG